MLQDIEAEIQTFEPTPFHRFGTLTPLEKSQMVFAHVLRQGRYGVLDMVAVGVSVVLICEHGDIKRPPKLPYFRAVQVGRAIRHLLKAEFKVYEREDGRTGEIIQTRVKLTTNIRMRSRNACQRVEAFIRKHADWFIQQYGPRLVAEVETKLAAKRDKAR